MAQNAPAERGWRTALHSISSGAMLLGIMGCALTASIAIGVAGGALSGQQAQNLHATETTQADLGVQYQLAIEDLSAGRYGLAVQRLRWVIERAPDYPGAAEALDRAASGASNGGAAALATLPPITSEDPVEIFAEAQTLLVSEQWEAAIQRLELLRRQHPEYQAADVAEALYVAQVRLGLFYIRSSERIAEGVLLLEQAAMLRPLDDTTRGEIYLATLHLTAESYWGLDWVITIENLEAIVALAPNYQNASERLFEARASYGDRVAALGLHCDAFALYELALTYRDDEALRGKRNSEDQLCRTIGNVTPTIPATATAAEGTPAAPAATGSPGPTPTIGFGFGIPTPRPSATAPGF